MPDLTKARSQLSQIMLISRSSEPDSELRFSDRIFSHAKYFLDRMSVAPNIYPKFGSSLLFSFGNSSQKFLEFELFEDSSVNMTYQKTPETYATRTLSMYSAIQFLEDFYSDEPLSVRFKKEG